VPLDLGLVVPLLLRETTIWLTHETAIGLRRPLVLALARARPGAVLLDFRAPLAGAARIPTITTQHSGALNVIVLLVESAFVRKDLASHDGILQFATHRTT
jgi:hypothetical protein